MDFSPSEWLTFSKFSYSFLVGKITVEEIVWLFMAALSQRLFNNMNFTFGDN